MPTTIVIVAAVEGGYSVFFGPVHLDVGERFVVEATQYGLAMGVFFKALKIVEKFFFCVRLLPESLDARVVHPAVEYREIILNIQGSEAERLLKPGNESTVQRAVTFRGALRVAVAGIVHDQALGVGGRCSARQPKLVQLPESRGSDQHFTFVFNSAEPSLHNACLEERICFQDDCVERGIQAE